jgi:hypothetical protein
VTIEVDAAVQQLRTAAERAGANLLVLEQEPYLHMLDAAVLAGQTAARWHEARELIAALFDGYTRLTSLLDHAFELQRVIAAGAHREAELEAVITGPSIELSAVCVAIDERGLLDGSTRLSRCTPDELLARMARDFETVRKLIFEVARAWDELVPRVADLRNTLDTAAAHARDLGEDGAHMATVRALIDELANALASDPLSVDRGRVDQLEESIAETASDIDNVWTLRDDLTGRLESSERLLDELIVAERTCRETRCEVAARVALSSEPLPPVDEMRRALERAIALSGTREWRAASEALTVWTATCRRALQEVSQIEMRTRAEFAHRNELRGRLEAYNAKAAGLGLIEDGQLTRLYEAAQCALFTAPSDLALADTLVHKYQLAITTRRGREDAT